MTLNCVLARNGDGFTGWFAGCVLAYLVADSPACKKVAHGLFKWLVQERADANTHVSCQWKHQLMLEIPLEIPRSDQPITTLLAKIGQAFIEVATAKGDNLVLIALLRYLYA